MFRKMLVTLLVALPASGVLATSNPVPTAVVDLDRIVAVVNNDVITANELELRLTETKQQLSAQRIQLPPEDVLRRQLLERMIVEQIQLQLAVQSGVRVTDDDVEKAIQAIASRNKLTVDKVYDAVRQQGIDRASYREQVRNQITIQQLVEREIYSRTTVSDSEIDAFLENTRTSQDTEYDLSHIFLAIPESATPEQIQAVKARADDVRQQITRGEDFARAAVTHSQGPDALKGGAIGWKSAGQLPELFVGALNQLKPDEVSEVLKGPNGFHILRLNDRRGGGGGEAVQQTRVRHILLKPSEIVSRNDARANLRRLRERIAQGEDFAELARSHSEDPVSASQGGDLGWISPGQTVPEFERAMQALAPGALSEPVESSFGVHLIQVLERRQAVSGDRARLTARTQIHARKADDRYEQWVRRLRDEAYVEYLLDLDD
jgi:peptidyl-prolyl cis-trans isomerase SurA